MRTTTLIAAISLVPLTVPAVAQTRQSQEVNLTCGGCPEFVSVPQPPNGMRKISHVAKTELTWRQYLAAYDDKACPIPRSDNGLNGSEGKRELDNFVEQLRLDWPATLLGPKEVECYASWVSERLNRQVVVPTSDEWLWFARSGEENIAFPWGDDPAAGNAAVGGWQSPHNMKFLGPYISGPFVELGRHLDGVEVAQFPPTKWGLYDVLGNAWELTADISEPEHTTDALSEGYFEGTKRVRIVGLNAWAMDWRSTTLEGKPNFARIINGRYSTEVAVRFVVLN